MGRNSGETFIDFGIGLQIERRVVLHKFCQILLKTDNFLGKALGVVQRPVRV